MDTKSIFRSKTAWVGAAVSIVGALQAVNWVHLIPNTEWAGGIASVLGVVMIVLRFMTSQPVTVTGSN